MTVTGKNSDQAAAFRSSIVPYQIIEMNKL